MTTHRCYIATLCALLCALLPAASHAQQNERADFELGCATEILANIMREFEQGYVDRVSADKLLQAAADGLVHATDPYSEYISEESMSEFEIMTTGKYGGVGSLIRKRGEHVLFAQPYKGAPADEVGIKVGDKIVAIDGKSATSLDIAEVSARLKGEPGTEVEVVIERNIDAAIDTLRITRRRISIPSVPYSGMLRDGVGYICHNDFIDGSYDELRRSLEQLMATDSLRGLVLDYRSNRKDCLALRAARRAYSIAHGSRLILAPRVPHRAAAIGRRHTYRRLGERSIGLGIGDIGRCAARPRPRSGHGTANLRQGVGAGDTRRGLQQLS